MRNRMRIKTPFTILMMRRMKRIRRMLKLRAIELIPIPFIFTPL